ncbi:MAG: polysaccharide deacetylase family protein [Coriobacteriia bacterium]
MSGGVRLEGRGRSLFFGLLRLTGIPMLLRHTMQRRRLTILLFHQQAPERFERSVRALERRYNLVPLTDALDALSSGSMSGLPIRPLAITFDDGRASNAELIPVFARHGLQPTIFITTGVVGTRRHFWWTHLTPEQVSHLQSLSDPERIAALVALGLDPDREFDQPQALTLEQLKALAAVADIQPHTRTHPVLTRCTTREICAEIEGSMADVRTMTGSDPRVFAYPNGAVSDSVVDAVSRCGIRYAVTTEPVLNRADTDPFRLGRIFVRDLAGPSELVVFASGLQGALKRVVRHTS